MQAVCKHAMWYPSIIGILLTIFILPATGAGTDAKPADRVLYVSSAQPNQCLTPWMDVFKAPADDINLNDSTVDAYAASPTRFDGETVNLGVSDAAFWLRFRIGLSPDDSRDRRHVRILDIGGVYPDRVEWSLFTGDGQRIAAGGSRDHRDAFAILELPATPQNYYLKVRSTTALLMHPHLLTWKAFLDRNKQKMIWFGLFAGIIIAVGVYNFYLYFQLRDSSYLWYVLHLIFVLAYFLGINGVTGTYLLPDIPDTVGILNRSFLGMMIATIALMTRSFLMSRTQTPVIDRMIVALFILGSVISLINLIIKPQILVVLLILLGIVVPSLMVLAAMQAYKKGFKPARLFMVAWSFFIIGVVLFALTNKGTIAFTVAGFHGFQIGSALAAILLSFSLGDRIRTLRKERDTFKKSMEQIITIVNSINSGVFIAERDTRIIRQVNLAAEKMIGRGRDQIIGRHCRQYIKSEENRPEDGSHAARKDEHCEDKLLTGSGEELSILKSSKLIELDRYRLTIESFVDITDLKQAETAVRSSEAKFRSLFESSRDAVMLIEHCRIMDCNKAALEMFGCASSVDLIDQTFTDHSPVLQPSGAGSGQESLRYLETALSSGSNAFEWLFKRIDGEVFPAEVMLSAVAFEGKKVLQALIRDISGRKVMEEELRRLASTDPLTGANNRRSFLNRGNYELARSRRYKRDFAFLMIDVDHFKKVNDTYGHLSGDMILKELVAQCTRNLRSTDLFGRLGGEEFAIILPETSMDCAVEVGERLRRAIAGLTIASDKETIRFTISIGVSMFEQDDDTLEKIIGRADSALYKAKQTGRNRVVRGIEQQNIICQ